MEAMTELIDDGYPVFLTGDFNEPSSLDYTEGDGRHPRGDHRAGAWPVSEDAVRARASATRYREVHPDPVDGARGSPRPHRRAHRLRLRGRPVEDARQQAHRRAGRRGRRRSRRRRGPPTIGRCSRRFEVAPVAMPTLVAVDARLRTVGDEITVTYNSPGPPKRDRDRARGRRARRGARDPPASATSGARRSSTRRAGTPSPTRPFCSTATATRSPASPSTCATREAELELTTEQADLRAGRADRGLLERRARPIAGTGSGSSRPRPRIRRRRLT